MSKFFVSGQYAHSSAKLRAMMKDAPMSAEAHAEIMRRRVDARRQVEIARENTMLETADILE